MRIALGQINLTVGPESIIHRPPSAELAEDQADTDSLPPYDRLDPLLERIVEADTDGLDDRVERLVWRAEYGAPRTEGLSQGIWSRPPHAHRQWLDR
jgi:NH3-dependent NAD+ synthetase